MSGNAASSWYNEVGSYNFNNPGMSYSAGHFTQMIWKGNTSMGCGASTGSDGKEYIVCHYCPGGNISGQFAQNVLPRGLLQNLQVIDLSQSDFKLMLI